MNDRLIIVGVAGVARSGKDTIAKILCSRHGFTRIGLADGVRSAFTDMDGPTWELRKELEGAGFSQRWALQRLGTECRHEVESPKLWVNLLLAKIQYLTSHHPIERMRFVIPDIRFALEPIHIRRDVTSLLNGRYYTWKVVRPGARLVGPEASHASETQVDEIEPDLIICNDSGIAELEVTVNTCVSQLVERP